MSHIPVAVILILVAVGTVLFHFISPWWWTPIASNWGYIDDTIIITFWVTGVVFVVVVLFMAYCVWRYRYREDRRAEYEPENTKMEVWLTVFTTVGVTAMLTPGLFVWNQFITVPEGAAEVEVVGQQWTWGYRFPGKDGKLGTSNNAKINDGNPFGVNPDDPNGRDDVLIEDTELHLPLGIPVKMLLRSKDVLHDFYVPEFRAKMDMVPGAVTYFWFTPTRPGTFDILCFELCGVGHYQMRGNVVVEEQADFQKWLNKQKTFEQSMAKAAPSAGDSPKPVLEAADTGSAEKGITR